MSGDCVSIARHEYWMRKALELAEHGAAQGEVPVGAVVVINDTLVGQGWNQPISSNDPSAHAEIIALRDAAKNIKNYRLVTSTLYVTLEPCTMCAGALVHARVASLVFGTTEPKSGVVQSNGCIFEQSYFNHQVQVQGGILAEQSSELISSFFKQRRQKK